MNRFDVVLFDLDGTLLYTLADIAAAVNGALREMRRPERTVTEIRSMVGNGAKTLITRALGTQGDNEPDLLAADTQPGDVWLLCTDGLSGMLPDETIEAVMRREIPLDEMADSLLSQALEAGGRDNVTLILCREGEG